MQFPWQDVSWMLILKNNKENKIFIQIIVAIIANLEYTKC